MKEQGNLDFDTLDELFGRRFFIVVTNVTVQDMDLCQNKKYYENVIKLYHDWVKHRTTIVEKKHIKDDEKTKLEETMFLKFNKHSSNRIIDDKKTESGTNDSA